MSARPARAWTCLRSPRGAGPARAARGGAPQTPLSPVASRVPVSSQTRRGQDRVSRVLPAAGWRHVADLTRVGPVPVCPMRHSPGAQGEGSPRRTVRPAEATADRAPRGAAGSTRPAVRPRGQTPRASEGRRRECAPRGAAASWDGHARARCACAACPGGGRVPPRGSRGARTRGWRRRARDCRAPRQGCEPAAFGPAQAG